jgi:hypothetical protein
MKTIVKNKDGMTKNNKRHYFYYYDLQELIWHNKKDCSVFQNKPHYYYIKKWGYYYFNGKRLNNEKYS